MKRQDDGRNGKGFEKGAAAVGWITWKEASLKHALRYIQSSQTETKSTDEDSLEEQETKSQSFEAVSFFFFSTSC